MIEGINEKILEKIESSKFEEEIKEFLKKMLFLEFDHSEEQRWWGRLKEYEKYIIYFSKKCGDVKK